MGPWFFKVVSWFFMNFGWFHWFHKYSNDVDYCAWHVAPFNALLTQHHANKRHSCKLLHANMYHSITCQQKSFLVAFFIFSIPASGSANNHYQTKAEFPC